MSAILITGGAGFIGSNLVNFMVKKYPETNIVNFDSLTYAANLDALKSIESFNNYTFVEGDIRNLDSLSDAFEKFSITGVIHLAAESHVDNSISNPCVFVETNILGTFNLLEVARRSWSDKNNRFLHVSTDEVYGALGEEGFFTEESAYAPNSPYSASKASSDLLVRSYNKTYGLNTITTNCSNNYGPWQNAEKLIPVVIKKAITGQAIPIYGNGKNIRDWLFVEDHCRALDMAFHKGPSGENYNIGGGVELTNIDMCKKICSILDELRPKTEGSYYDQVEFVTDRLGHDFRYAIDSTKSENELGFKANFSFEDGIKETVKWYLNFFKS
jgi:dTDP-glucose 4,6-dehydratase